MFKTCRQCQTSFEITDEDLKFYDKVSPIFHGKKYLIPPPTLCPECRMSKRMTFRNERTLYTRKCDLTGKEIVSMYSPNKPYTIYDHKEWWLDTWDPLQYGKDFDFSKSFFEQFNTLLLAVPRESIFNTNSENCEYNNYVRDSKNCYLCSLVSTNTEQAYYSYWLVNSSYLYDCLSITDSQLLYECIETYHSYDCRYLLFCKSCRNCYFGHGLSGCSDCYGCVNLKNKQYHIFNKGYTKEEYSRQLSSLMLGSNTSTQQQKEQFYAFQLQFPHRAFHSINVENCSGENIRNIKNGFHIFDGHSSEDVKYINSFFYAKDFMDGYGIGSYNTELSYEGCVIYGNQRILFSTNITKGLNILYSDHLISCSDCFGCAGLKNKQYCVLNKQYTKEEYETLVPKIIGHMMKTPLTDPKGCNQPLGSSPVCEWGEFFSPSLSPFGYNETVAQEYFPLTKEEALAKGFNWSDYESPPPTVDKVITLEQMKKLPDNIKDIPDDILNWALTCEVSGKLYKIIKPELKFYRDHNLPIPRRHPDQRHKDRMALRNPRKLWTRNCMKCNKEIQTTYSPDRPEIVYCEECYLKEVY